MTEAVKNCPKPLTLTVIRSFLGLASYYRRFMDGFASIASPLTTLTQKSKKFEWSEACEKIVQILKDRLTFAIVLTLTMVTMDFVMYCDAYRVGLWCVLIHHGKVVVYPSRNFRCMREIIQLMILKIWSHCLYIVHVNIYTEHKSVQYVCTQCELNLRQRRWLEL